MAIPSPVKVFTGLTVSLPVIIPLIDCLSAPTTAPQRWREGLMSGDIRGTYLKAIDGRLLDGKWMNPDGPSLLDLGRSAFNADAPKKTQLYLGHQPIGEDELLERFLTYNEKVIEIQIQVHGFMSSPLSWCPKQHDTLLEKGILSLSIGYSSAHAFEDNAELLHDTLVSIIRTAKSVGKTLKLHFKDHSAGNIAMDYVFNIDPKHSSKRHLLEKLVHTLKASMPFKSEWEKLSVVEHTHSVSMLGTAIEGAYILEDLDYFLELLKPIANILPKVLFSYSPLYFDAPATKQISDRQFIVGEGMKKLGKACKLLLFHAEHETAVYPIDEALFRDQMRESGNKHIISTRVAGGHASLIRNKEVFDTMNKEIFPTYFPELN